jgi:uncharacterized membrane protein
MKQKDFKFQSELFDYPDICILALLPFLSSIINSTVYRFNPTNLLYLIINLKLVLMEAIKESIPAAMPVPRAKNKGGRPALKLVGDELE